MRTISKIKTDYIHSGINEYGYTKFYIRFQDNDEQYQVQLNDDERQNETLMISKIVNFLNENDKSYLSVEELEKLKPLEWVAEEVITDERIRPAGESPI